MSYIYENVIRLDDTKGDNDNDSFSTKNWKLKGVSTKATRSGGTNEGNLSDDGKLYVTLVASSDQVKGRIYQTIELGTVKTSDLVATFTGTNQSSSIATIVATNSSGLSGEVTVMFNEAHNDNEPIKLQVVYSLDSDVALYDDPKQFEAYTEQSGIAPLHNEAAFQINQFISHRFRERLHGLSAPGIGFSVNSSFPLFNNFFIAANEPDLARVHNPQQLRRASSYYALYLAYSRDFLGNVESFDPYMDRANNFYQKYVRSIENVNLDLDVDKDGEVDDVVSGGGFNWTRS